LNNCTLRARIHLIHTHFIHFT